MDVAALDLDYLERVIDTDGEEAVLGRVRVKVERLDARLGVEEQVGEGGLEGEQRDATLGGELGVELNVGRDVEGVELVGGGVR